MQVVLTTPTGNVGRHVVRDIIRAGLRPRIILRDASRLAPELGPYVDIVEGDQGDADLVVSATAGAEALFWVTPSSHDDDDPLDGYRRMSASVTRAVRENAIGHTLLVSSVGAELRHGAGEIDGLALTEVALDEVAEEAGVCVVHLRCGYFFSNLLMDPDALTRGVLSTAMPVDAPMPWVDPADIAAVATGRLLAGWSGRQVQAVHGPEDLSFTSVASILSEVLGHRIQAEQVSEDQVRAALRAAEMTDQQVEAIVGMSAGLRDGFVPEQPRSVLSTTPRSLRGWAMEQLRRPGTDKTG